MNFTIQLQVLPDADQQAVLLTTMERFNEAATFAAKVGFEAKVFSQPSIHKLAYREIRERFGLSAQMAVRAIGKAVECFKRDKTELPRLQAARGRHLRRTHPRLQGRRQGEPLDDDRPDGPAARLRRVPGRAVRPDQGPVRSGLPRRQVLPVRHGRAARRLADRGQGLPRRRPRDRQHRHRQRRRAALRQARRDVRRKHNLQRKRLGKRNTKGAKKKLEADRAARRPGSASTRTTSSARRSSPRPKTPVAGSPSKTSTDIRDRLPVWARDARNRLSGWSFAQLVAFVTYKAELAGVPVVTVDPRNTSRTCAECGHCEKANRKTQARFLCVSCGHSANADHNAARNIRALGVRKSPSELASLRA